MPNSPLPSESGKFSIEVQTSSLLSIGVIMAPSLSSSFPSILQPELLPSDFTTIALKFPPALSVNAEKKSAQQAESINLVSNGVVVKSISECTMTERSWPSTVTLSYDPSCMWHLSCAVLRLHLTFYPFPLAACVSFELKWVQGSTVTNRWSHNISCVAPGVRLFVEVSGSMCT